MDIHALTLGRMLHFCGQFVDGQVSGMLVDDGGAWKVRAEMCLGFNHVFWFAALQTSCVPFPSREENIDQVVSHFSLSPAFFGDKTFLSLLVVV